MNTSLKTYSTELDNIRVEEMKIENVNDDLKDQVKLKNKVIKANSGHFVSCSNVYSSIL